MNKFEIRAAASVGLLYVVRMLGLFMVLPVLPLVADDIDGATPLMVGLAIGTYGLSQAFLQIPLGLLSDRVGRKPVIVGGLIIFVVGSLVAGFANDIYGIVVGRFLQGCGAVASTLLALVADVTRVEHRSKAMAIVGMSIGGSFGIALILGPWLANFGGIGTVFLFTAGAGILGIVVVATVVPTPTVRSQSPEATISAGRIVDVLVNPDLRRTSVGVFMLHYLLMSSFVVLPVIMHETGAIDASEHHYIYFWLLLASFMCMLPLMWLADRKGYARAMMLLMIATFIASILAFSRAETLYPVLASMLLFFMAFNLMETILPALVSKLAPATDRGTAMGVYSTAQFAGGFAGGALGGLLVSTWEITHLMYANAAICLIWLIYAFGLSTPGNHRTITCSVPTGANVTAQQVAAALLSVAGVVDVAYIEDAQLAYIKVDVDRFEEDTLERLDIPALTVLSR